MRAYKYPFMALPLSYSELPNNNINLEEIIGQEEEPVEFGPLDPVFGPVFEELVLPPPRQLTAEDIERAIALIEEETRLSRIQLENERRYSWLKDQANFIFVEAFYMVVFGTPLYLGYSFINWVPIPSYLKTGLWIPYLYYGGRFARHGLKQMYDLFKLYISDLFD